MEAENSDGGNCPRLTRRYNNNFDAGGVREGGKTQGAEWCQGKSFTV